MRRALTAFVAGLALMATAAIGIVTTTPVAGAAGDPSCIFSFGSQSGPGNLTNPVILTGLSSGSSVHVACTGLPVGHTVALLQASPLAVSTVPFALGPLAGEADLRPIGGGGNSAMVGANGEYNASWNAGTTAAGTFQPGSASLMEAGDPNAQCPPTQAQINAGLATCIMTVADITNASGTGPPSSGDFAGEALIAFTGQASPQVPPTISATAPAAPGHSANLTDAGADTSWWGGGWWAGGYPGGGLTPAPYSVPNSNILVNGATPSSSSVSIKPAQYCFYGLATSDSCVIPSSADQKDTPGNGKLLPTQLQGAVHIPSSAAGASATVQIFEPNVWGSVFPGNNTSNHGFPANDLTGTGGVPLTHLGYWELGADGGLFSFGTANFYGSMGGKHLDKPIVGMAPTIDGGGYWEVASDGGLFSFGNAKFYGSMGGKALNDPIVGMAATADSKGYWEVASDGGLFAFGDAKFYGSMGGKPLDKPIVGMAATADGKGYWEVASDGGLFAFGDAKFHGSMGGKPLNKPIVAMTTTPDGGGYWEVASDGGLFSFGDAHFYGSMGGKPLNKPIVDMWTNNTGTGYWEEASDGGIFAFKVAFLGSMGGKPLNSPIVAGAFVPIPPTSSVSLAITSPTAATGYGGPGQAAGDHVDYRFLVTNTGQAPLTNVSVSDTKIGVSCPSSTLAPGAAETCTGTYTITQADVDHGSLTNSATANASGFEGIGVSSGVASVTQAASGATSAISLAISSPESASGFGAPNGSSPYAGTIDFTYTVTNTGTTSESDISVTDATAINPFTFQNGGTATPETVTCPAGTIAPGQSLACHSTYDVTQADVDSGQAGVITPGTIGYPLGYAGSTYGQVANTASASAQNAGGAMVGPATTTFAVNGTASTFAVSLDITSPTTGYTAGGTVEFDFTFTNTGTVSINSFEGLVDNMGNASDSLGLNADLAGDCLTAQLAAGQSTTCTADYTVPSPAPASVTETAQGSFADVDFGNSITSAVASATVQAS